MKSLLKLAASVLAVLAVVVALTAQRTADAVGYETLHPNNGGAGGTGTAVGTGWQNANHGGFYIRFKGGASCTASYGNFDYRQSSLDYLDWDNRISSVADYNSCDTQLWQFANYTGDHSGGADGWFNAGEGAPFYNLDVWDERTTSIRWS